MTELDSRWAWSRIEAVADGSLGRKDERRMRAALARDPELRRAVDRARALRRGLGRLGKEPVPSSLQARLLRIATPARGAKRHGSPFWSWASAAAAASTMAVALLVVTQPEPPVDDERQMAALRDFELAMAYVHRSYEIAGEQVRRAVERELREAFEVDNDSGGDRRGGNGG